MTLKNSTEKSAARRASVQVQAIDLSEDEGERNDDWVPAYAFPVAAADKKILPPRNWRDPSEDGDDSGSLMI